MKEKKLAEQSVKSYYGSLCTMFYDIDKPAAPQNEIIFYLSFASKASKILEPMCGSGRMLLEFAKTGFNIDGFDLSQDMIARCKQKLAEHKISSNISINSFESFSSKQKYDYIFIAASSICLFTNDKDLQNALKKTYDLMRDDAVFVFAIETLDNAADIANKACERIVSKDNLAIRLSYKQTFDAKTKIASSPSKYELFQNNKLIKIEEENFDVKYYSVVEFDDLLKKLKFTILNKYSDYNFTEYKKGHKMCIYVVKK